MKHDLRGKRCVGLVRTSTMSQTENGLGQQLMICRKFAEERGMIWVDTESAPGVSAYQTENRWDIDNIFARKRRGEQFEVVVVQEYSRLTRGGVDHGGFLLWEFAKMGLTVVSATQDIPDNEYAPLIRAIEFMRHKGYSESTAFNTARGRMAAILDGRSTHCGQPPFAVDRLYTTARGEKLFRLRNLPDGSQVKLPPDPDDDTVLAVFEPNIRLEDGSTHIRHYKKQPHEKVTLVMGESMAVEAVKYILHRAFFEETIGAPTIAYELNVRKCLPAHDGGLWNISSVYGVMSQPVYVGMGVCNYIDEADIYNRTRGGPRKVDADARGKQRYRPESEWEFVPYPDLLGERSFLPPELRERVWQWQLQRLRDRASGVNRRDENDSHSQSSYFLKDAIRTSEGHRMRGHTSHRGTDWRYYAYTKYIETPTHRKRARKHLFPAKALEEVAAAEITSVLSDVDAQVPAIKEFVKRRLEAAERDNPDLGALRTQRAAVADELAFSTKELAVLGVDRLRQKIEPLRVRLAGLDQRIIAAESSAGLSLGSADEITAAVVKRLWSFAK